MSVRTIVDVSASMSFGSVRPKLHVVADFVEALGMSAFRVGDALGMMAFDEHERTDMFFPARVSRGMGTIMAEALRTAGGHARAARPSPGGTATGAISAAHAPNVSRATVAPDGLDVAASRLAGQQGLVFLASDFHWPLRRLDAALDLLAHASVVPIIVWDLAEIEPPTSNALANLRDAESGARRTLWLRPRLRDEWRKGVARRRAEINSYFADHSIRPFYIEGHFNADTLSRYFFEAGT